MGSGKGADCGVDSGSVIIGKRRAEWGRAQPVQSLRMIINGHRRFRLDGAFSSRSSTSREAEFTEDPAEMPDETPVPGHAEKMQQNPTRPIAGKLEVRLHRTARIFHFPVHRYSVIA